MKKPPPTPPAEEEEEALEDRKPPAKTSCTTDSQSDAPSEHSVGSIASSSTIACTPLIIASPTAKGADLTLQLATIDESQQASQTTTTTPSQFQTQVLVLGGTSLASIFAFISIIIPASALAALALFMASTSLLFYQVYQYLLQQYGQVINGRGIGDFLPGWLFSMLVEDSIHEQLLDESFALEWRHLALYFFPGLTRTQVEAFVHRLAPRHRDFLLRPGAGHVLGDEFMQLILGRERFPEVPEAQEIQMQNPAPLPPPMNIRSRRLQLEDDEYSAAESVQQPHQSTALPLQSDESISIPREAIVSAPSAPPDNDEEADHEGELSLLIEAFSAGMSSFVMGPVVDIFSHFASQATELVTTPGFSLALVSGSMGVFGLWRGVWGNRAQGAPSSRDVWTTAVLGGGVAGILYVARRANSNRKNRRPASSSPPPPPAPQKKAP